MVQLEPFTLALNRVDYRRIVFEWLLNLKQFARPSKEELAT
jgi:hypothetical protein